MTPYNPPRRAIYCHKHGLCFAVLVLAERHLFGRHEYQIQSPPNPTTIWVTDRDGRQLQFQEDEPC